MNVDGFGRELAGCTGGKPFAILLLLLFACFVAPQSIMAQESGGRRSASDLFDTIYDTAIGDSDRIHAYKTLVENPISPPDTKSPRATLESFLVIMRTATDLWVETRDQFFSNSNFFLTSKEKDQLELVSALLGKAALTFDMSAVPAASRERASVEIVLQMQEILDRVYLPALEEVPGVPAGLTQDNREPPERWTIPGTNLTIALQEDGPRAGEYLFTQGTVDRIPSDYDVIKALPIASDRGEDLYSYYIYTPGNLVAPQWYQYILSGPPWLQKTFSGQTVWQWAGMALLLLFSLIGIMLFARWNARRAVPVDPTLRQIRHVINPALLIVIANAFQFLCEEQINITGGLLVLLTTVTSVTIWTAAAWFTYQALQLIYLATSRSSAFNKASLDVSLIRTAFRVVSFLVAIIVLGYGATRIGIPIYGVVAGLGVGGLAIALAAQPTLENFIGGMILYADRIIRVGEFCQFEDMSGTVEEIGIRSTRIRALDRTLIIVSNADLAKRKIINYSQRDVFLFRHKIGLRYETESQVLRAIIADIRNLLEQSESVLEEPLRVRLIEYADFSILIDVYANIASTDLNAFLEVQEDLLISIRSIVENHGAGFAFPSSTVYLSRDQIPEPITDQAVSGHKEPGETSYSASGNSSKT